VALVSIGATLMGCASNAPIQGGVSASPPPAGGYFSMKPVGSWSHLPSDATCASRVHQSSWEPRPDNGAPNNRMPDPRKVHTAFRLRPPGASGGYDPHWDRWLLPRVDGHFTGTTDEIFQWGACKWGLPDNLLRAIAVRESTWYQYEVYPNGRPVINWGSGDMVTRASPATLVYCHGLSAAVWPDYQRFFGVGVCPETFSIMGVMSWEAPSWGKMLGNQNGTYPFNRRSTAFSVDYIGSQLRGCYEGWETWLDNTGTRTYSPGQIWGCVGAWYAGAWHTPGANGYISRVSSANQHHPWLAPGWADIKPRCSNLFGCPRGGA
jgi:hypothetical protein